jgi:hypothetical protein
VNKTPDILPDAMARAIADAATEHGYGVEHLTLSWIPQELGVAGLARVSYSARPHKPETLRDAAALAALPAVVRACIPLECLPGETMEQMFARKAWRIADAFIAARETGEK